MLHVLERHVRSVGLNMFEPFMAGGSKLDLDLHNRTTAFAFREIFDDNRSWHMQLRHIDYCPCWTIHLEIAAGVQSCYSRRLHSPAHAQTGGRASATQLRQPWGSRSVCSN